MKWLVVLVMSGACVSSGVEPCGDRVCAAGTHCAMLDTGEVECATQPQLDACKMPGPNDTCTTPDHASGYCNGGVCLPILCGDDRIEPGEVCDDGNTRTGDGCSGDCMSVEACGNGHLDPLKLDANHEPQANEQCDDGNLVSGDGCSSTCLSETDIWRQVDFTGPGPLAGGSVAYDVGRNRMVMFGGGTYVSSKFVVHSDTYESNGHGWARAIAPTAPTARSNAAMAYDPIRQRTLLFGGQASSEFEPFGDMWGWDGTSWRPIAPAVLPSPRAGHTMAYDAARHVIVLFGGRYTNSSTTVTLLDDTWEWDGTTWTQIATPTKPPARWGQAMAYDPTRARIVMVGGFTSEGTTPTIDAATWAYDGTTWSPIATATTSDSRAFAAEAFAGLAYSPIERRLIGYGGRDRFDETVQSDNTYTTASPRTYGFDGLVWTRLVQATQDVQPPRSEVMMVAGSDGAIFTFGGAVPDMAGNILRTALPDTAIWTSSTWSAVPTAPSMPLARSSAATATDPDTDTTYMFGGRSSNITLDELWSFHDSRWTKIAPAGPPSARQDAGMVWDQKHAQLVLFGGHDNADKVLADTWVYANAKWKLIVPPTSPSTRSAMAMVWDARRERVVLFGGANDIGALAETWEFDGATWSQITTAHSPSPRAAAGATYDPITHLVLVGGGLDPLTLAETWGYDGTDWTLLSPSATTPRGFQVWSYDGTRERAVQFGGGFAIGLADTWEWDGKKRTWAQIFPLQTPPARVAHAAFATRAGVYIFGGRTGADASLLGDMWLLRSESTTPPERCEAVADNDLDGKAGCDDPDCWATCHPACPPGTDVTCTASVAHCGDGTCDPFESCHGCPMDCACTAALCGDTFCDAPETHATCPGDCP